MQNEKAKREEKFIVFIISLALIGLMIENLLLGWEFWVPFISIPGVASLWIMHLLERPNYRVRKVYYFMFAVMMLFYHGVHKTSFVNLAITMALAMVVFSLLNHVIMLHVFLGEYFFLFLIHLLNLPGGDPISADKLTVSVVVLHVIAVLFVYFVCIRSVNSRMELERMNQEKDGRIESYESDMEDFLSNISHELRTPVNVVNGMSDILLRKSTNEELGSIKKAGLKLADQIEDIQDYIECKREKVLIEEDDYMSTSLIHDVVTVFRNMDNKKNLELVVDLDPKAPSRMRGDIKKLHKIFRLLTQNAVKFTRKGGVYIKLYAEPVGVDVNLCVEVTDTGIGMDWQTIHAVSNGLYQVDKKRNRSTGGIGLGLFIVYGFVHAMGGCVKIESEKRNGTMVRLAIPQKVVDAEQCLKAKDSFEGDLLFHVRPDKYSVPKVRDFYRSMAANLASGIRVPLYPAETVKEVERLCDKLNVKYIFMGQEEYEENTVYFDELSKGEIVVAVSAEPGFRANSGSSVMVMPKPLYAYPVIQILNEGRQASDIAQEGHSLKPEFSGVSALVVDDEPMNLVVASGLFREYDMEVETADGGREAIQAYRENAYDVVFMDHMMPGMDGVEAMKEIKKAAAEMGKKVIVIALTANAVAGAKEMFMKEGFDGFIAKPIDMAEFERVMLRELSVQKKVAGGDRS
ncbi:MAG: response regulator [Lachnospiraceae bacterium]|nr:response regulator [Lachnospiraceae bacterium]